MDAHNNKRRRGEQPTSAAPEQSASAPDPGRQTEHPIRHEMLRGIANDVEPYELDSVDTENPKAGNPTVGAPQDERTLKEGNEDITRELYELMRKMIDWMYRRLDEKRRVELISSLQDYLQTQKEKSENAYLTFFENLAAAILHRPLPTTSTAPKRPDTHDGSRGDAIPLSVDAEPVTSENIWRIITLSESDTDAARGEREMAPPNARQLDPRQVLMGIARFYIHGRTLYLVPRRDLDGNHSPMVRRDFAVVDTVAFFR